VIEQKRREAHPAAAAPIAQSSTEPPSVTEPSSPQQTAGAATPAEAQVGPQPGSPEGLEEEAGPEGAFNPETGEINWDCPCLGGMANGPCGEEFKAAFSCFVYSSDDPKGMDCIDKFQQMQDCFRKYPEIYGAELQDDEEEDSASPVAGAEAAGPRDVPPEPSKESKVAAAEIAKTELPGEIQTKSEPVQESREPKAEKKEGEVVPRAAVDATGANTGKKEP
jgi:intermembrane space import and assembly protein 40